MVFLAVTTVKSSGPFPQIVSVTVEIPVAPLLATVACFVLAGWFVVQRHGSHAAAARAPLDSAGAVRPATPAAGTPSVKEVILFPRRVWVTRPRLLVPPQRGQRSTTCAETAED